MQTGVTQDNRGCSLSCGRMRSSGCRIRTRLIYSLQARTWWVSVNNHIRIWQRNGSSTNACLSWRRQWQPTPVLLPGKSHGRRSLVGCSPWGCEELDMTEWLHFRFSLSGIGEGNGNPLQYSCLENPRDSRAWWAAVYGVAQSWTRLKWLSSSSSSSSRCFKSSAMW